MPISAVLANDEVMLTIKPGEHGSTYGGNPLASKVGMVALQVLIDEEMAKNAEEQGQIFRKEIQRLDSKLVQVSEVYVPYDSFVF